MEILLEKVIERIVKGKGKSLRFVEEKRFAESIEGN